MTTVFVTASGTDVGKTYVVERLVAALAATGRRVRALKPVASGFDASQPAESDSGRLLRAQRLPVDERHLDAVSPWRFAAPLSPDMAAAREARTVPFGELVAFCRAPMDADVTIIEGIGGVMVPLDATHTVLDWIAAIDSPALLVVGSYLGTLSHTLTALAALRARSVPVRAIVVSESLQQPVPLAETCAAIARFAATPVHGLPRDATTIDEALLDALSAR